MRTRIARVPDEPAEGEEKVEVRVRHLKLGIVKRTFHPSSKMNVVYDWVGSLNLTPEHFTLADYKSQVFAKDQLVADASTILLYMRESSCDIASMNGYSDNGADEPAVHTMVKNYMFQPSKFLPINIMEGDER